MITSDHWSNFSKLNSDRRYIIKLQDKLIKEFKKNYKIFFNEEHDQRFWRILLGPWCLFYLSTMFERWEVFRLKKKKILFKLKNKNNKYKKFLYFDIVDFLQKAMQDHLWNLYIFCRINIFLKTKKPLNNTKNNILLREKQNKKNQHFSLILRIFSFLGILFNKNFYDYLGLSFLDNIKLCIKLKHFPTNPKLLFPNITKKNIFFDLQKRKIFFGNFFKKKKLNMFEKFLISCLQDDFPIVHFEEFKNIKKINEKKLKYKKNKLFLTTSHYFNENFKMFAALSYSQGSEVNVIKHGGSLPHYFDSNLDHDEKISDNFYTWDRNKKFKNITPFQLLKSKNLKKNNLDKLLFLGMETTPYPIKFLCMPYYEKTGKIIKTMNSIIINLKDSIKNKTVYRYLSNTNLKFDPISKYLKKNFKFVDIRNTKQGIPFHNDLSNAKLSICLYPETPFAESIISNTPTLLFFDKKFYRLNSNSNLMLKDLSSANIYFSSSKKLTSHINMVWDDPYKWWNSSKVQKIIKKLRYSFFNINDNWLDTDYKKLI